MKELFAKHELYAMKVQKYLINSEFFTLQKLFYKLTNLAFFGKLTTNLIILLQPIYYV